MRTFSCAKKKILMELEELRQLIKHGETSFVQFKEMFSTSAKIADEMIAFANVEFVDDKAGNQFKAIVKRPVAEGYVAVNVAVNTKYLSERLSVNRKTIQRDLATLQEQKLIQWVGSDKTGHWEIITNID